MPTATETATRFAIALQRALPGSANVGARRRLRLAAVDWANEPEPGPQPGAGRGLTLREAVERAAAGIAFSGSGRAAVETALASVEEPAPSPALREQAARAAQILVTLSDASIRALRVEAAGDEYLTGICDRALDEDLDALEQVAEIMAERELGERAAREQDEPAEDPEEDPRVGEARDW